MPFYLFTSVGYVEWQEVTRERNVIARKGFPELCFQIIWSELALARDTMQKTVRMVRLLVQGLLCLCQESIWYWLNPSSHSQPLYQEQGRAGESRSV